MQSASNAFAAAASGGGVLWDKPAVRVDWAVDGYGAVGSIDDLDNLVGRPIEIEHYLDDGYPDAVTFVAGIGAGSLSTSLGHGGISSGANPQPMTPVQYFSPFRTDSPLYPYQVRDIQPVKVDAQVVTADGVEAVRVFTGQLTAIPLDGLAANLTAQSATRLKLSKSVQLPAYHPSRLLGIGLLEYPAGLTATWPVVWAMHQCGVYPSPPAVSGCRYWLPMHGGLVPFSPSLDSYPNGGIAYYGTATVGEQPTDPTFTVGPYVGMASGGASTTEILSIIAALEQQSDAVAGDDFLSASGSRGRVQFYVRGDPAATNTAPGGSGAFRIIGLMDDTAALAGFAYVDPRTSSMAADPTWPWVTGGVGLDRKPFVTLWDGATKFTLRSPTAIPADGGYYLVGVSWDVAGGALQVNNNGTISATAISPTTSHLRADELDDAANIRGGLDVSFISYLPTAELQMSTGYAAVGSAPWMNTGWTQNATVYPSILSLQALAEPPREAWELIGSYAQAEAAAFRTDENDNVLYLTLPYWALPAQQTVAQALSAGRDSGFPKILFDPTKTRNSVTVSYMDTRLDPVPSPLLTLNTPLAVPPGSTTYTLPLTTAGVNVGDFFTFPTFRKIQVLSESQINGVDDPGMGIYSGSNYVAFNDAVDGSGSYAPGGSTVGDGFGSDVTGTIDYATAQYVTVTFTNLTGTTYYVANDGRGNGTSDFEYMAICGTPLRQSTATVTVSDGASIALRGERNLAVPLPLIQDADMATRVAGALLGDLAQPQPIVTVDLFGDPRRQPGDLVTYSDADNSGLSGYWRIRGLKHTIDAARYTQAATLRRTHLIGSWDAAIWDTTIWGI